MGGSESTELFPSDGERKLQVTVSPLRMCKKDGTVVEGTSSDHRTLTMNVCLEEENFGSFSLQRYTNCFYPGRGRGSLIRFTIFLIR